MPSMKTELYLMANQIADFIGSSANLSGEGFSGMQFITRASTDEDYQQWINKAKQSPLYLDQTSYDKLVLPSKNNPVQVYQLKENSIFDLAITKYMYPQKK
jgi:cytochrome o ubiquinol oxidase subunit 2